MIGLFAPLLTSRRTQVILGCHLPCVDTESRDKGDFNPTTVPLLLIELVRLSSLERRVRWERLAVFLSFPFFFGFLYQLP